MAKYGYKEGQGLGKKEQGMSTALQVQKTSFRIGRIIHENDMLATIPNPLGLMAAYNDIEDEEYEDMQPPASLKEEEEVEAEKQNEPTLADILKNPSNVLLLKVTVEIRTLVLLSRSDPCFLNDDVSFVYRSSEYGRACRRGRRFGTGSQRRMLQIWRSKECDSIPNARHGRRRCDTNFCGIRNCRSRSER